MPTQSLILTEIHTDEEQPPLSTVSNGSVASEASTLSRDSIVSNMSNTTASVTSSRMRDLQVEPSENTGRVSPLSINPVVTSTGSAEVAVMLPQSTAKVLGVDVSGTPLHTPFSTRKSSPQFTTNLAASLISNNRNSAPATPAEQTPIQERKTNVTEGSSNASASSSLTSSSTGTSDSTRVRKISAQNTGSSTPKREVYV